MTLDKIDKEILTQLYHNWRMSISKIAKLTKHSRRQIEYRLSNYLENGIISSFFTVFDYSALGFKQVAYAFIKLKNNVSIEKIENLFNKSKRCTSWGFAISSYGLFSNWIFINRHEAESYFSKLKKNDIIEEINIIYPTEAIFYPLKSIDSSSEENFSLIKMTPPAKFDNKDKIIMQELSKNARKSIVKIAEKVNLTPEACLYRLKSLKNRKIILGSRIQFNLSKSEYYATCLFINSKQSNKLFEKLKKYCSNSQNINYFIANSSNYPKYIIQVFHRDELTLRKVISDIKKIGPLSVEAVLLHDDFGIINPTPFW